MRPCEYWYPVEEWRVEVLYGRTEEGYWEWARQNAYGKT